MRYVETRKLEMLVRVRKFGEVHHDLLAASTGGAEALATVSAAVDALRIHADERRQSDREEKEVKAAAREALLTRLKAIRRAARVIGKNNAGFDTRFSLPKPSKQTEQAVLSTGRNFCREAALEKDRFLAVGLRATFVEDLEKLVGDLDGAILDHEAGKDGQTAAQAGITSTLANALDAIQLLDIIVGERLGDDAKAMAVWERDRKVDLSRRRRAAADSTEPEPASAVVTPVTAPAPAPPLASTPMPVPAIARPSSVSGAAADAEAVRPRQAETARSEDDVLVGVGS